MPHLTQRKGWTHSLAVVAAVTAFATGTADAQDVSSFPDKPLRVVVPFAPGGATDQIARTVAQALGERVGQTVVVENKAGASGNIGALTVARAAPEGCGPSR